MKPHVIWIHGANQTCLSFAYLKSKLPNWEHTDLNYSSYDSFYYNLEHMIDTVKDLGPLFVIGHSMGGLYAMHLYKHCNVVGAVSISTPFRGVLAADWAKAIAPGYQLFHDVGIRSKPVKEACGVDVKIPWTQIVSTKGNVPYMGTTNDGVVSLASMRWLDAKMEIVEVEYTHYEVMFSPQVAQIIEVRYLELANKQ